MKYTMGFRIWHWLNAIVILGLLGTVFLRKTFLSWRTNSEIIMTKLTDMGADIFKEDAIVIAKAIRGEMWQWHLILGYALLAMLLFRVALFFFDKSQKDEFNSLTTHKKGVKISYYIVYATIIFITVSGFAVYLHEELELSQELTKQIKNLHELSYNVFLVFVPLHIIGVFVADAKDEHGLISTMVNGKTKENF